MREQIIRRPPSGNLFERAARVLKIGENEFFGHAGALFVDRGPRSRQRLVRFLEQRDVTQIRDGRPIAGGLDVEDSGQFVTKTIQPDAGLR